MSMVGTDVMEEPRMISKAPVETTVISAVMVETMVVSETVVFLEPVIETRMRCEEQRYYCGRCGGLRPC